MKVSATPLKLVPIEIQPLASIGGLADWDWVQARTAYIQGTLPRWVITMSMTTKKGAHGCQDIYESVSVDGGASWSAPKVIDSLNRKRATDGCHVASSALWLVWHEKEWNVFDHGEDV
ncbi:MAG: hypothetical protein M2R45_03216 [Verrucomicrobia subdivision 3 bacterium]|nr:hypothetical protein [Limisphaerales bacterium]MCS1413931.1 hypothetical protein [Limisphaerales bacterium]